MYLNVYVPQLQYATWLVSYIHRQLGMPVAWHASHDGQPVHLLAAVDQRAGAVLAQVSVNGKTNEITAFAPLLDPLDLAECGITADDAHPAGSRGLRSSGGRRGITAWS